MTVKQTDFSSRLRRLRLENNLTPEECAKILDIHRSTIVRYEKGDRYPNFQGLIRIAELFSVSTDYLLGRADKRNAVHEKPGAPPSFSIIQLLLKDGQLKEEKEASLLDFDKESDLIFLRIQGRDYLPDYASGDLLVFKRDLMPKNGHVILWKNHKKVELRTYYRRNNGTILVGIAPYAPPEWIANWNPSDFLGSLTHVIHGTVHI